MKNIFVSTAVDPPGLERLKKLDGVRVAIVPEQNAPHTLPAELLAVQHVLLCQLPPDNLADMKALQWIQLGSSGFAQVAGRGLPERNIRACNAAGIFDSAIAEWNVAMMINLQRDLRGMMRNQDAGVWDRDARFHRELRGSVAGLWGYGGSARETARLLKAMGLRVHVMVRDAVKSREGSYFALEGVGDPKGLLPDRVYVRGDEREFLGRLDFLIMAIPLTGSTHGLIGEAELRALPPHACLLNPARGPLVQEEALLRALREGWIAGAALDTHYQYPMPAGHPLWHMPQVIMTPHISGSTGNQHYLRRLWALFVDNVERDLAGKPLLNELSAAHLNDK